MSATRKLSTAAPESRGASILSEHDFLAFLNNALDDAAERNALCGLLLLRLSCEAGGLAQPSELAQAAQIFSQLVRQPDAVAVLAEGALSIVLTNLERRSDAYIMLDRLEAFAKSAGLPWALNFGVSVYPFSGATSDDLWDACSRDLEGAISSDSWEHTIPRDTLFTRSAG